MAAAGRNMARVTVTYVADMDIGDFNTAVVQQLIEQDDTDFSIFELENLDIESVTVESK